MPGTEGIRFASQGASTTGPRLRRAGPPTEASLPLGLRIDLSRYSGYAWGALLATVAFLAMTCWWLSVDRSIPIYDAGGHLETAFQFHEMIKAGNLLGPFNYESVYPPLVHLIGALGVFIGGVNVPSPIIADNLVFVPLLALGCYRTGRLLFGSAAGMLAVIFVLGSPLIISQLHVFMLDPPMTAMVAVCIWLLLASERFKRLDVCAALGVAAGIGLMVKVQTPVYLLGFVLLVLARGGWRNWRGIGICALIAAVIAAPWYLAHISEFSRITEIAGTGAGADVPPGNAPPTFSIANLLWYFWSVLNSQLLLTLALLAVGGAAWMAIAALRRPEERGLRLDLLAGCFLTWLTITITPHHDIRYGMPLMAYVAVIATGWIVCLPRAARVLALVMLALGVAVTTLGITFGVGGQATLALAHPLPETEQKPDRIIFYATQGFLASGPSRDGNVPGLLDALRRDGVNTVAVAYGQSAQPDFSFEGLQPLGRIAGLHMVLTRKLEFARNADVATLVHTSVRAGDPPTCTRVSDGTGVWVVRYDGATGKLALYCPRRRPRFYAIGNL